MPRISIAATRPRYHLARPSTRANTGSDPSRPISANGGSTRRRRHPAPQGELAVARDDDHSAAGHHILGGTHAEGHQVELASARSAHRRRRGSHPGPCTPGVRPGWPKPTARSTDSRLPSARPSVTRRRTSSHGSRSPPTVRTVTTSPVMATERSAHPPVSTRQRTSPVAASTATTTACRPSGANRPTTAGVATRTTAAVSAHATAPARPPPVRRRVTAITDTTRAATAKPIPIRPSRRQTRGLGGVQPSAACRYHQIAPAARRLASTAPAKRPEASPVSLSSACGPLAPTSAAG